MSELVQVDYSDLKIDYEKKVDTIACIVPAYNEEETIKETLESILNQTRPPETVYVIINNTTDETYWIAREYEGSHMKTHHDREYTTTIVVVDAGKLSGKKVAALNMGWEMGHNHSYILGVDGDTVLDKRCVEYLEAEMASDSRIGGISAIYSFDDQGKGFIQKFLVAGQRQQFAGFEMDNLLKNRNMAVLGGQCSLLRVSTLKEVMRLNRQTHPWVHDSSVEDSLLSLQIKSSGYSTKISARARANVGAMTSLRSLYAQQNKWNSGAIELMKLRPFHPNLRMRWRENFSMVFNILTRVMFALLVIASVSIGAFLFHPIWLIPPVASWLLGVRTVYSMKNRTVYDTIFGWSFIAGEIYTLLRITHFISAWYHVLTKVEKDTWSMQASAESGKGSSGILWPVTGTLAVGLVFYYSWTTMQLVVQTTVLAIGWPVLGIVAAILTLTMLKRLTRKHRGFMV